MDILNFGIKRLIKFYNKQCNNLSKKIKNIYHQKVQLLNFT